MIDSNIFEEWPDYLLTEMADPWLFASAPLSLSYPILLASGPMLYQFRKISQQGKWICGTYQEQPFQFFRLNAGTAELEPALFLFQQKKCRGLLFLSICGSLDPKLSPGQIVQVTKAQIGEGMSLYYEKKWQDFVEPYQTWNSPFPLVSTYTTQSLLQETNHALEQWALQHQVIECEISALFTLSQHLKLPVLALSVVSDVPVSKICGIRTPAFRKGCQEALSFLQTIQRSELSPHS